MSLVACGCISSIFLVEDLRRTNFAKIKSATEVAYRNEILKMFEDKEEQEKTSPKI